MCGELVRAIKSRVRGAANLSSLIEQQQNLAFVEKFGLITELSSSAEEYRAPGYQEIYAFLHLKREQYPLSSTHITHLQKHYMAVYDIPTSTNPEFRQMETSVQLWYACRVDKTIFHCLRSRRQDSSRLNHLACIEQLEDRNARYSDAIRARDFQETDWYVYVQFYCVHKFRGHYHMLMYSSYRWTVVVDGLVEDKGHRCDGFQDICVLQHLCAKVTRRNGKVYFMDAPEKMEKRICESLGI